MSSKGNLACTTVKSALVALAFMLAGASVVLADDASMFVSGTKVNGVLVGGMTVDEAKVQIEGFYGREYKLSVRERNDVTEVIKGSDIGYRVLITDGLQSVLAEQNASGRVTGPAASHTYTVKGTAGFDTKKLDANLKSLTCISGKSVILTADAHISEWQQGVPFTIIPEVQGNSVNAVKMADAVNAALNAGLSELNLEEAGCYDTVTVTTEDAGLKARCDALNQVREMTVTYPFGNQAEVLWGDEICSWITGMTDGRVDVDEEKAAAYIKTLADKYDTAGKERIFHTAGGRDIPLTGAYGWQLDQAGETAALITLIQAGQTQSKEPQYIQTAADRNNDWGGSYVEADMAAQHVYMYQNGTSVWDSPCVTGNVSRNNTTPEGIYSLAYKQTDRILRGDKKADGTYEYESHVDYWMPFNGGIGFHDASWRSKFGGTIYQTGGSHGCVNLPPDKAKLLYNLVYQGIPIICHY